MTYRDDVLASSPTGWYRHGEASGTTAVEEISALNGTYAAPTLGHTGATSDGDTAVWYDGVDDKTTCGSPFSRSGVEPFSISTWLNRDTTQSVSYPKTLDSRATDGGWMMEQQVTEGVYRFRRYRAGGSDLVDITPVAAGTWQHITITYDGATLKAYDADTEVASIASTGSASATAMNLRLGSATGAYWKGFQDETIIWFRALSAVEVSDLHASAIGAGTPTETQRMAPDAILAMTGLTGTVAAIQDDPDAADAAWLTVT